MKKLNDFLNNDMDDDDMEQFAKEILQQKFDADNRAEITQILAQEYGVKRTISEPPKFQITSLYRIVALAASIALLIGLFLYLNRTDLPQYEQLATTYIEDLPIMADQLTIRKDDTPVEEIRQNANAAYIKEDFAASIKYFKQLETEGLLTLYDQFYLALGYLKTSPTEPQQTIQLLNAIKEDIPAFKQEIDWVLSLAYLKNNQTADAKTILQKIVSQNDYQAKSAQLLLESLD
ncbi:MAG: hypothetical protein AAGJ93_16505 [Bacteroidota bacterium]